MIVALLLAAGLLLALAYGATALYVADLLTRTKRRRVEGTPRDLGLRYEDVQFRGADDLLLRGWFLDSPGARATVVLLHDAAGTRSDHAQGLLRLQHDYVRRGYHVLAFDLRGRGESSGGRDCLGGGEQQDVAAAVAFARRRGGPVPLVLHGFGLGGALAIAAVADGVHAAAVVADSPFASAREHLRRRWRRLPAPLFRSGCWVAHRLFRADVDALSPIDVIAQVAPTPVLLIHGEDDDEVPVAHSVNIAAAAFDPGNELWTVAGAGHCEAYAGDPQHYLLRCLTFIEQAVPARQLAAAG